HSDLTVGTGDAWTVDSIHISESHGDAVQGEVGVPFTVILTNHAAAPEPTPLLEPSATLGEVDVSGQYAYQAVSTTPNTPTVEAGGSLVINGTMTVGAEATPGLVRFGARID